MLKLLAEGTLKGAITLPRPEALRPGHPALCAMTDLRCGRPVTVSEDERLQAALGRMIQAGVRLLLSTQADGRFTGLITSYDIQGEKPVRFLNSSDCLQEICNWQEVRVRDIHTPVERWPAVTMAALQEATVADVLTLFADAETTHLLIVEQLPCAAWCVCGLISKTEIQRRLHPHAPPATP